MGSVAAMGSLGFVLFSLLIATQANIRATATKCIETKECSAYDVICKNADYEVRHYNASKWVSTSVQSYFMEMAAYDGFRKLFKYITGANAGGVHIDMTSPVLIKKSEARNMWEPVTYTISFLLPAAYQDAAPAPINGDVHFLEMPEMYAYVKSFGGWMLSVNAKLYSNLLSRELNAASASYNTTFYYGAGYNSPRTVFNRHNEVWYIAEGKPKCSGQQT
ncbi:heme-binding protein 2 isoform X2 [Acipenser oxyrinchus oxyrinchus]|uniref:Heme-binding protein 1 n=1 Tax=Acipenser oxyrinchus oxyrinchus TaxID=40147 RepID=A0AAD8CNE0_ACIOX|nr:heme-binding protein 2 isoform X2 [Acipenser oxyrinchus oxyrinchus]